MFPDRAAGIDRRSPFVLNGPNVILILKIAVLGVTCLFLSSLIALSRRNYRLHGRINMCFFVLTSCALLGLEVVARLIDPTLFDYFEHDPQLKRILTIHLCFSLPSAAMMPF